MMHKTRHFCSKDNFGRILAPKSPPSYFFNEAHFLRKWKVSENLWKGCYHSESLSPSSPSLCVLSVGSPFNSPLPRITAFLWKRPVCVCGAAAEA